MGPMLVFWIVMAAIVYFALLAGVLVFFAGVSKMNRHWERVFHEPHGEYDEHWHRAA
jgi:hypothetical protein